MTKKNKVIRTIAAVTAVALLGGGIYLLVKNDVAHNECIIYYKDNIYITF